MYTVQSAKSTYHRQNRKHVVLNFLCLFNSSQHMIKGQQQIPHNANATQVIYIRQSNSPYEYERLYYHLINRNEYKT